MKVFVLAPRENWIVDRLANEWQQNNQDIDCSNPADADVIWLLAGWCWRHIHPNILAQKKVICTIHHVVPEKFTDSKIADFMQRDTFVDAYHVPNKFTYEFVRSLTKKDIFLIPYWCNDKLWYPLDKNTCSKNACRSNLKIAHDTFVVGSFQRDTEGGSLKPKLEKGPDIFCDFVERASKTRQIDVLLGGWRRGYVTHRLENAGINYKLFELSPEPVLRMMYSACDLYVVSSRFEGGPQAILECAAMHVPIISNDVGIAKSVLHEMCIVDVSQSDVIQISQTALDYNFKAASELFIKTHRHQYREMMRKTNAQ